MKQNKQPEQMQQVTCGRCNSLKHMLLWVSATTEQVKFSLMCDGCGSPLTDTEIGDIIREVSRKHEENVEITAKPQNIV